MKISNPNTIRAIIYCWKRENSAVFLDRKDNLIKEFPTYDEAIEYATENIHLIDRVENKEFQVGDILSLKSPHVDFTTTVSFRGLNDGKAVIFDKKAGNQFSVPLEWLSIIN